LANDANVNSPPLLVRNTLSFLLHLFSAAAWIFLMDYGVLLFSARKAAHMYLVASSTSSRM
jgi:hypothetical protein